MSGMSTTQSTVLADARHIISLRSGLALGSKRFLSDNPGSIRVKVMLGVLLRVRIRVTDTVRVSKRVKVRVRNGASASS